MQALELILKAGAKWSPDERCLKRLRRELLEGHGRVVIRLLELLREYGVLTQDQLHELTRTPAVRRVLDAVSKRRRDHLVGYSSPPSAPATPPAMRLPSRGHWRRHWSQR